MGAIVVTGAAGFVGQRVLALLAAGGHEVVAVDAVPLGDAHGARSWLIDLARDPGERIETAMAGALGVIHLAWSHSEDPAGDRGVAFPNLVALRRTLQAAERAGVRRVVHISSATVYGAWPDNPVPLGEDAPLRPNPGFGYAVEKGEGERLLAQWADEHGAAVAVLRPSVTVGSSSPALYQALAGTLAPHGDDGLRPMQFLDVADLAVAVVFAWEQGLTGVYNVAPDGWITHEQARAIVGGVARVRLPEGVAGAVAALGWRLLRTGVPGVARPYAVHPWVVANDRLRAAGWTPWRTNEEALSSSEERVSWRDLLPRRRRDWALLVGGAAAASALSAWASAVMGRLAWRVWRRRRGAGAFGR